MTEPRRIGGEIDLEDDLLQPVQASERTNPFEDLRKELTTKVESGTITLEVKARNNVAIRYDCNIDIDMIQAWRKRCADKKQPEGIDPMRFACTILASQAEVIIWDGIEVVDPENREPLNFRHRELLQMVNAPSATAAVRTVIGNDAHVFTHVNAIMTEAGFDDEVTELDPTQT